MTTPDELRAAAAPACASCGEPVLRVEYRYSAGLVHDHPSGWRLLAALVCVAGCRVPVEPLP
jgi:hypothetical protein